MEGRIIKSLSGFYYVQHDEVVYQCRGRGLFRKNNVSPLVGDIVQFEAQNKREGLIMNIGKRKNDLIRPPIANVDQALLVFSAKEPDFSPILLDRFLVLIEANHIEPIICITKMDLLNEMERDEVKAYGEVYEKIGYKVIFTSTKYVDDIALLYPYLADKVTVFAGQSGVGKSSLLNAMRPELALKTNEISSSLGRGKHTTRHVELIAVNNGLVADTPGFSSLEFHNIELEELSDYFMEISEFSRQCKFRGCMHLAEPKCAVKDAVENGSIAKYRYEHYCQFIEEIKERKPRYSK